MIKWQKPNINEAMLPNENVLLDSKINPKLVRKSTNIENIIKQNHNRQQTFSLQKQFSVSTFHDSIQERDEQMSSESS